MNLENRIEVGSVSEFLEAVKQIYCDQDHQLFYRGVSKEQYATPEHDHPGIYRNKNLIENEDKMFYELTAKCPEYFKDCKTTFEHLVMMQHYDYPTRLLDITSNPLVSLYFACGGKNGANSEDGQLISYHIKKNDIRNYESDRVGLLSIMALSNSSFNYYIVLLNQLNYIFKTSLEAKNLHSLKNRALPVKNVTFIIKSMESFVYKFRSITEDLDFLNTFFEKMNIEKLEDIYKNFSIFMINIPKIYFEFIKDYNKFVGQWYFSEPTSTNIKDEIDKQLDRIHQILINVESSIECMKDSYIKFSHNIRSQKPFFDILLINSLDMRTIQCVLPKQNNPRLIAQQGAFLLFGFKDAASNKTATPIVPDEMYGKFQIITQYENRQIIEKQQSSQKAEIIIKGSEKQKILDELKILGISNSTMFPEIDNIANELKSQYAKLR